MNSNLIHTDYIGRFAPSPTGPLHFGSLVAATASYLDARAHHGKWLLRMEDLDKPREMKGAARDILNTLEAFGFTWDEKIIYQSHREAYYADAFEKLKAQHQLYPCGCTRRQISEKAVWSSEGLIYPGICRNGLNGKAPRSWRVKVNDKPVNFTDRIQGRTEHLLSQNSGDFIVNRADGLFSYQLAVVVDDAAQNISHVVRGADLLHSTPKQIHLQNLLAINPPHYAHVPVATNLMGEKLSKQTRAQPINARDTGIALCRVLVFLGMTPPNELQKTPLSTIWDWAIQQWQIERVPRQKRQIALFPAIAKTV